MNQRIQYLVQRFIRSKQASASEQTEEVSLDPRPALPPPKPEEHPIRKAVRRVFPFKRYKNSGTDHAETE
jgi:hypothetical protein